MGEALVELAQVLRSQQVRLVFFLGLCPQHHRHPFSFVFTISDNEVTTYIIRNFSKFPVLLVYYYINNKDFWQNGHSCYRN